MGKSSLINRIVGRRNLARSSRTPGRTQGLMWYGVEDGDVRLLDLPGYGHARISRSKLRDWGAIIPRALTTRTSLKGIVVLVDIRHGIREMDRDMMNLGRQAGIDILGCLHKADTLGAQARHRAIETCRASDPDVTWMDCAARTGLGMHEVGEWVCDRLGLTYERAGPGR